MKDSDPKKAQRAAIVAGLFATHTAPWGSQSAAARRDRAASNKWRAAEADARDQAAAEARRERRRQKRQNAREHGEEIIDVLLCYTTFHYPGPNTALSEAEYWYLNGDCSRLVWPDPIAGLCFLIEWLRLELRGIGGRT